VIMAPRILLKLDGLAWAIPILRWLPHYQAGWFRADVIAGLTLWGILVPEGIAYAGLAGAPVQAGLYTLLASLVAYAILGTTRQAVSAPTSGSSIMMATVAAPFLVTGPSESAELLVLLVLVVGIIFLVCGLVRLGFVIAFISHSVMTGFVFGLAIYIAVSQAPKLLGLSRAHGETLYQLWHLIGQLGAANWVTFAIGAGGLALLYIIEARAPRAPGPLMIMAAGILIVSVLRLTDEHGVQVVGIVQPGLPVLSPPRANFDDVLDLLPGAFAITSQQQIRIRHRRQSRIDCVRRFQRCRGLSGWTGQRLQRVIDGRQRPGGRQEPSLVVGGGNHGVDHSRCADAAFPQLAAGDIERHRYPCGGAHDEGR
jgi:MFS superfamily sulfate permease-like transporter